MCSGHPERSRLQTTARTRDVITAALPPSRWPAAGSARHVYDFDKDMEELHTNHANAMVLADTALFEYDNVRWVGDEAGFIEGENWNVIDRDRRGARWRECTQWETGTVGGCWIAVLTARAFDACAWSQ